jgi:Ca-activated chloride channel homolog
MSLMSLMSFAWPPMVAALFAAPLLVVVYLRFARARAKRAEELAAKGFVPNAAAIRNRRRRHIPFAFFVVALTGLLASLSRPQATLRIPKREGTVILAFDVSNSMRADDLKPTRIEAAKKAARRFVEKQPTSIKIGVVAFSDGGVITQKPTNERTQITAAIDRLKTQGGTSLGQGIFSSLNAISGTPIALPTGVDPNADSNADSNAASNDRYQTTEPSVTAPSGSTDPTVRNDLARVDVASIKIGYFGNSAIVLLSDGENTSNPKPVDLAELASVAGVKIYPIGIGKSEGAVVEIDGFKVATALDEGTLQEVAKRSGGSYFAAPDADSLNAVYDKIDLKWGSTPTKTELTGVFAGVSAALFGIGALLSLKWFGRLV